MKGFFKLGLLALTVLAGSAAYADQFGLTYINTNDINYCERVASEVNLLSNPYAEVYAYCAYEVVNGYEFTLITNISTQGSLMPDMYIPLANLDSNDPSELMTDLGLLTHMPAANSGRYPLAVSLLGPSYFVSSQGNAYAYRIQVGVVIR